MALLKCPDCGRDVSSEAPACVGCGRPMQSPVPPVSFTTTASQPTPPPPDADSPESLAPQPQQERGLSANGIAFFFSFLLVGLIAFAYFVATGGRLKDERRPPTPAPVLAPASHAHLLQLTYEWRKGGFGSVMTADFAFHNSADVTVRDPTVACRIAGPSGTNIGTLTRTIYVAIPPHEDRAANGISMGFIDTQASGVGCSVVATGN